MTGVRHVEETRDHWWWRPGWRQGRHMYACHFTFVDQPTVQRLAATYRESLAGVDGLDLIPPAWLHLTMQEVGFTDVVSGSQAAELSEAVTEALRDVPAPVVTFQPPVVRTEAIFMSVLPANGIVTVRAAVRDAISAVLGPGSLDVVQSFNPHVSIAYANRAQPALALVEALSKAEVEPVTVTLGHVGFLEYHRDNRMYEWTHETRIPIGLDRAAGVVDRGPELTCGGTGDGRR